MRSRLFVVGAGVLAVLSSACAGGIDLSKIPTPQIVIAPPAPVVEDKPAEPVKPKATLAFHVLNLTGDELDTAIATVKKDGADIDAKQARANGYIKFDGLEGAGAFYDVTFDADGYKTVTRKVQLGSKSDTVDGEGNRQFDIILSRDGESIVPKPIPSEPPVVIAPPPVVAPAPSAPVTDDEFKAAFFAILKKHGNPRTVNLQTLNDTKADVEAIGCEWQHDSAGTLRPRLFLPVAPGADIYSRAFDVGLYGEQWQWIKR